MKIRVRIEGIERLKTALSEIKKGIASPQAMDRLSNGLKERIVERAALGRDAAGERFKPYEPQYARGRARRGEGAGIVTLRRSGEMLDSIKADGQPAAGVSFNSFKEAEKARYLQETGVGRKRTKRRFFAISDADSAWALKILSGHAQETIRKASVKGGEG